MKVKWLINHAKYSSDQVFVSVAFQFTSYRSIRIRDTLCERINPRFSSFDCVTAQIMKTEGDDRRNRNARHSNNSDKNDTGKKKRQSIKRERRDGGKKTSVILDDYCFCRYSRFCRHCLSRSRYCRQCLLSCGLLVLLIKFQDV